MSRTLRQVQAGTLRPVVTYSGEPSRPGIDHTQPMEGTEAIGGAESEDTTYSSALLPRIEQLPRGIVVAEAEMGRATGQWIVLIRCECATDGFSPCC